MEKEVELLLPTESLPEALQAAAGCREHDATKGAMPETKVRLVEGQLGSTFCVSAECNRKSSIPGRLRCSIGSPPAKRNRHPLLDVRPHLLSPNQPQMRLWLLLPDGLL